MRRRVAAGLRTRPGIARGGRLELRAGASEHQAALVIAVRHVVQVPRPRRMHGRADRLHPWVSDGAGWQADVNPCVVRGGAPELGLRYRATPLVELEPCGRVDA